MAILPRTIVLGISFLASQIGLVSSPDESDTVLNQITRLVAGGGH